MQLASRTLFRVVFPDEIPRRDVGMIVRVALRDVDADVVVDFVLLAFPVPPPTSPESAASEPKTGGLEVPFFALPGLPGATRFALIGDSGSGDASQRRVAEGMLRYFLTARRFTHVLMLGDNLYHDASCSGCSSTSWSSVSSRNRVSSRSVD